MSRPFSALQALADRLQTEGAPAATAGRDAPAAATPPASGAPSPVPLLIPPGLLIEAAEQMERCHCDWDRPSRDAQLVQALRVNSALWDALRVDLLRVENPLPEPARRNLLIMSAFVDQRTLELLSQPTAESLQALIDLDRNLAARWLSAPEAPGQAA